MRFKLLVCTLIRWKKIDQSCINYLYFVFIFYRWLSLHRGFKFDCLEGSSKNIAMEWIQHKSLPHDLQTFPGIDLKDLPELEVGFSCQHLRLRPRGNGSPRLSHLWFLSEPRRLHDVPPHIWKSPQLYWGYRSVRPSVQVRHMREVVPQSYQIPPPSQYMHG